jgi:hypothetical protein
MCKNFSWHTGWHTENSRIFPFMALLTDTKARHIKPDDRPLPHGGITGLTLHPSSVKGRESGFYAM